MEGEKLKEGEKTFEEDKDKYDKFKQHLHQRAVEIDEKVRLVNRELDNQLQKINDLKKEQNYLG